MEKDQDQAQHQGQTKLQRTDESASGDKDKDFLTKGRLSVKLKMPTREHNGAVEGTAPMADGGGASAGAGGLSTNNQNRVCQECGKVFASGKAFGGHKRIHVQAAKKSQKLINLVVNKNDLPHPKQQSILAAAKDHQNNAVEEEVSCAICGKAFISMKALFGHMRFHPDRGWRGIQPPNDVALKAASSTSTLSDDRLHMDSSATTGSVLDLKDSLRGWSVTAKRGRKSLLPASSASGYGSGSGSVPGSGYVPGSGSGYVPGSGSGSGYVPGSGSGTGSYEIQKEHNDDDDDQGYENDLEEAVNDLLIFARGGSSDGSPKKKRAQENKSSINGAGNKLCEDNLMDINGDHTKPESSENRELSKTTMKRKKKRRLCDLEREGEVVVTDQNNQGQHICITCNKPFPTHQALGGHRASHNKLKNVGTVNNAAKEPAMSGLNQDSDNHHVEKKIVLCEDREVSTTADHQCNICSKSFPTGQALGGHKRCHWIAPAASAPAESQGTSSSPEEQQQPQQQQQPQEPITRAVHSFDLNELPPREDN